MGKVTVPSGVGRKLLYSLLRWGRGYFHSLLGGKAVFLSEKFLFVALALPAPGRAARKTLSHEARTLNNQH